MRRITRYAGTTLLVLVMFLAAFTLFAPRLGWRIDTVMSGSMSPTVKSGAILITQPVDPTNIKVGDIITYGSPLNGKLVTHRVIEIRHSSPLVFQTKGDSNKDPDPYTVPPENVLGKVCFNAPLLGYIARFLQEPMVLLLAVSIPGIIIIVMEIRNIWCVFNEEEARNRSRVR